MKSVSVGEILERVSFTLHTKWAFVMNKKIFLFSLNKAFW